jgi:hypothetical protein
MSLPKFAREVTLLLALLGLWTVTRPTMVTASFGSRNSASRPEKGNLGTSQRTRHLSSVRYQMVCELWELQKHTNLPRNADKREAQFSGTG